MLGLGKFLFGTRISPVTFSVYPPCLFGEVLVLEEGFESLCPDFLVVFDQLGQLVGVTGLFEGPHRPGSQVDVPDEAG